MYDCLISMILIVSLNKLYMLLRLWVSQIYSVRVPEVPKPIFRQVRVAIDGG